MRRLIATLLLPVFLFGALVPVKAKEDLAKLPFLVSHYKLHKKQFPATTFFQYFSLHYGSGFAGHRNAHDHSGLPLKGSTNTIQAFSNIMMAVTEWPPVPRIDVKMSRPFFSGTTHLLHLLFDIWQPPK